MFQFLRPFGGRHLTNDHSRSIVLLMDFLCGMNTLELVIIRILDHGYPIAWVVKLLVRPWVCPGRSCKTFGALLTTQPEERDNHQDQADDSSDNTAEYGSKVDFLATVRTIGSAGALRCRRGRCCET